VPTQTPTDTDPQRYLLDTVRESQAAVIDTIRTWTGVTEQLARTFRVPMPDVDFAGLVDRAFDVAEQTLAAQHQLARTLVGVATRQVDTAVETVDTAVAAVDIAADERVRQVEGLVQAAEANQDRRPDGRTYEERSVEELRERAGELEIEGRSAMNKDELITALRDHRKSRSAKSQSPKQERQPDRRTYEERSVEELQERARELEIEGRSTMSKDELIAALRQQAR
jgi:Rho termination factor, N-terminal domain